MALIRKSSVLTVLFAMLALLTTAGLSAQTQTAATITGRVTDVSGAAIPKATILVSSPALQVPVVKGTTDADGNFNIINLPAPGVYRVEVQAPGFGKLVRTGLQLTAGFTAKLDTRLTVGSVTEAVEVNSAGPVIDTVSTVSNSILNKEEIQDSPKGLGLQELLPLTPGVSLQGKPDVGDSNLALKEPIMTYGVVLEPTLDVEGINTTTAKVASTAVYLDSMAFSEVEFKTSGNNADVAFPGVAMEAQMKSGGNQFHGDAQGDYENPNFQGNNITPTLAGPPNNLTVANPLAGAGYYDYAADIGGRVITDKLWFYAGYSKQQITQGSPNFHGAPDSSGNWMGTSARLANIVTYLNELNYKLSYQLGKSTKVSFSELIGHKFASSTSFSPTRALPATDYQHQPDKVWRAEAQTAVGTRFLFDGLFGYSDYSVNYTAQPASNMAQFGWTKGSEFAGSPSEEELSTSLYTGPNVFPDSKPHTRWELKANGIFMPTAPKFGGTHQFQFGTEENWETNSDRIYADNPSGDYLLQFQNGKPNKIVVYNYPFPTSADKLHSQAGYLTDLWKLKRVSLNLGVRIERYHSFVPQQTKPAGQFSALFPSQTFAEKDVLTWNDVVPRVGAAWDIRGNGKTVLKAFFGIFGDTMGDAFGDFFNANGQQSKSYNWTGPCAPTDPLAPVQYACDATPSFLGSLASLTPVSQSGAGNQILNPNLKQDKTYQYTVQVQRQLVQNVALNFGYVRNTIHNLYDAATNGGSITATADVTSNGVDVGHVWNVPVTFTDNFNGVSTPVTVYSYSSGTTQNEFINNPSDRPDTYNSFEVGVTKRYSKRWDALSSFWATKNHRWIQGTAGIAGSPNDDRYPIDDTWNWEARADVVYRFPLGFQTSAFYRVQSGVHGQRTEKFNSSALKQGSTTLRMGPFGEYSGPVLGTLNFRVAKVFKIHDRFTLQPNFQIFNVLNSSGAVSTNYLTGASTFGVAQTIISPRVARIGALFTF